MHAIRHISVSIVSLHHEILLSLFFLFTREILYDWNLEQRGSHVNPVDSNVESKDLINIISPFKSDNEMCNYTLMYVWTVTMINVWNLHQPLLIKWVMIHRHPYVTIHLLTPTQKYDTRSCGSHTSTLSLSSPLLSS